MSHKKSVEVFGASFVVEVFHSGSGSVWENEARFRITAPNGGYVEVVSLPGKMLPDKIYLGRMPTDTEVRGIILDATKRNRWLESGEVCRYYLPAVPDTITALLTGHEDVDGYRFYEYQVFYQNGTSSKPRRLRCRKPQAPTGWIEADYERRTREAQAALNAVEKDLKDRRELVDLINADLFCGLRDPSVKNYLRTPAF